MESNSYKRAEMPKGSAVVLDERTLETSNKNLLKELKKGQHVLDVGCGSGAITHAICHYVGDGGEVTGIDRSEELIQLATLKFSSFENLDFICDDILKYKTDKKFDIITSARTLQWIEKPETVISKMIQLLKPEGKICILDYNHTLIEWKPLPPISMLNFYDDFLKWRSDAGMDNEIGDSVLNLLQINNLKISSTEMHREYCERGMSNFHSQLNIWEQVANLRGKQMVKDGYLIEKERLQLITEYSEWCATKAQSMSLYLKSTHATI